MDGVSVTVHHIQDLSCLPAQHVRPLDEVHLLELKYAEWSSMGRVLETEITI